MNKPLKRKSKITDTATDGFLSRIKRVERKVYKFLNDLVGSLNRTNGKIDNDAANRRLLLGLESGLLDEIRLALSEPLPAYLENFDEVEKLNRLIYDEVLTESEAVRVSRMVFDTERIFLVDNVTAGLTSPDLIRANLVQPIRNVLYQGIVFRQPINKLQENLRREILTTDGSKSGILRYTRQITQDAISQFDGAINDRIRDEIGLEGMRYVGSIIATTRSNCSELVTGSGRFKALAVEPGLYRVSDLDKIVELARGRSGFNPATTAQTFAQYRGGFGCRHEVIYVHLEDD